MHANNVNTVLKSDIKVITSISTLIKCLKYAIIFITFILLILFFTDDIVAIGWIKELGAITIKEFRYDSYNINLNPVTWNGMYGWSAVYKLQPVARLLPYICTHI